MIVFYAIGLVILGTIIELVVGQAVRNRIAGKAAVEFEQLRSALGNRNDSRAEDTSGKSI